MQTMQDARTTQGDIWVRLVRNGTFSKNVARGFLAINFSEQDKARMDELAYNNSQGKLSAAEREELESYVLVGDVLSLLHLKARKSLKR